MIDGIKGLLSLTNKVMTANLPREYQGLLEGDTVSTDPLIQKIIMAESSGDPKAVNKRTGAKGLMQVMPYTAKLVAKQAKLPYSKSRLTTDPEYNIKLGSYYFNSLIENYNGIYPFAIAAYNAGPNRVKTWRFTM